MKKILASVFALMALVSCGNRSEVLLPNVSGKAGEVIVVMNKPDWEGALGNATRELLAADCPWLPVREPLYSLVNIAPADLSNLFKVHRNIVFFDIDPQVAESGVKYLKDRWARPQCLVSVAAPTSEDAIHFLATDGGKISAYIEQAERDRVISNTLHYEEKPLYGKVSEVFGGSPHFPTGYSLKKRTEDFIWIADEKQYTTQGVFIYKYPVTESDPFSEENIIAHRDAFLKNYVPGMFDNTYMITSQYVTPGVKFLRYHDLDFAETRGLWEVYNDLMGGPFVSHSFYSKDGKDIIVLEAWVYAAKYDKRQYLRQVESLLYSFEWDKVEGQ